MSALEARIRTNYFAVMDKKAFQEMVENLSSGEDGKPFLITNKEEQVGFCCDDVVYGLKTGNNSQDHDEMNTAMIKRIQELLVPGHACILTEVSWEKLVTVNGMVTIITKDNAICLDLMDWSLETARTILNDPAYSPYMVG